MSKVEEKLIFTGEQVDVSTSSILKMSMKTPTMVKNAFWSSWNGKDFDESFLNLATLNFAAWKGVNFLTEFKKEQRSMKEVRFPVIFLRSPENRDSD